MKILVQKGSQRMWVKNPKRIKFWEALAASSNMLAVKLGGGMGNVCVLKRVK